LRNLQSSWRFSSFSKRRNSEFQLSWLLEGLENYGCHIMLPVRSGISLHAYEHRAQQTIGATAAHLCPDFNEFRHAKILAIRIFSFEQTAEKPVQSRTWLEG
jgi:hypothetical protein